MSEEYSESPDGESMGDHQEHPTPECPNCGGRKTRPLDDEWATCFDCDDAWMMAEAVQEELADG